MSLQNGWNSMLDAAEPQEVGSDRVLFESVAPDSMASGYGGANQQGGGGGGNANRGPMTDKELIAMGIKPPNISDEEYFCKISDVFVLRRDITAARRSALDGLRQGTPAHQAAMQTFKGDAVEHVIDRFFTSTKMPASYQQARGQFRERQQQFYDIPHYYKDISFFGSCMALQRDRIATAHPVGEFTAHMQEVLLLATTIFSWKEAQRGHTACIGLASAGKSHLLKGLFMFLPRGVVRNATHQTGKANAVGGEVQMHVSYHDELSAGDLGMGAPNQRDDKNEALAKAHMTDPRIQTVTIVTDDGRRQQQCYLSFIQDVRVGAYNGETSDNENALGRRWYKINFDKYSADRHDTVVNRVLETTDANKRELARAVAEQETLINFYVMLLEFLIFTGCLEDVNMTAANLYLRRLIDSMRDRGYELDDAKKLNQILMMTRQLTVRHAVEVAFFSDLTYKVRHNDDGSYKPFDQVAKTLFMLAETYLLATREIVLYAVTLARGAWGSQLETAAISAARNATIAQSLSMFSDACFSSEGALQTARVESERQARRAVLSQQREVRKKTRAANAGAHCVPRTNGAARFADDMEISDEAAAQIAAQFDQIRLGASDSAGHHADTEDSRSASLAVPDDAASVVGNSTEFDEATKSHRFSFETRFKRSNGNGDLCKSVIANYVELTNGNNMTVGAAAASIAAHAVGVVHSERHLAAALYDLSRQRVKADSLRFDCNTMRVSPSGCRALFPVVKIVANSSEFDVRTPPPRGKRVFMLTSALLNLRSIEDALYDSIRELGFRYTVPARVVTALPMRFDVGNGKYDKLDLTTNQTLRIVDIERSDEDWIHTRVDYDSRRLVEALAQTTTDKQSIFRQYRPSVLTGTSALVVGVEPEFTACQQHELAIGTPPSLANFGTSLLLNMSIERIIRATPVLARRRRVSYAEEMRLEFVTKLRKRTMARRSNKQLDPRFVDFFTSTTNAISGAEERFSSQLIAAAAHLNPEAALNMLEMRSAAAASADSGAASESDGSRFKLRRVNRARELHARATELRAGEGSSSLTGHVDNVYKAILDDVERDTNAAEPSSASERAFEFSGDADFGDVSSMSALGGGGGQDELHIDDVLAHVSGSWRTRSVPQPASYTRSAIVPRAVSAPIDSDAIAAEQRASELMSTLGAAECAEIDAINEVEGDALLYTDEDAAKEDGYTAQTGIVGEPVEYADQVPSLFERVQQSAVMPRALNMSAQMNSFNRKIENVAAQQHQRAPSVPDPQQYPPEIPVAANMPLAIRRRFEQIRSQQHGGAESN